MHVRACVRACVCVCVYFLISVVEQSRLCRPTRLANITKNNKGKKNLPEFCMSWKKAKKSLSFKQLRRRSLTFMFSKPPDLELEGLFKRHFTTVKFYQGSIMSTPDLQRVKVFSIILFLYLVENKTKVNHPQSISLSFTFYVHLTFLSNTISSHTHTVVTNKILCARAVFFVVSHTLISSYTVKAA